MRYPVVLTRGAERDIEEIQAYIAEHSGMSRADHVLAALDEAIGGLARHPERGNIPKELRVLGIAGYREVHFKPYRIVYRVLESRVAVYCVLDGRRDMQTLLQQRLVR
jgi:toxin ParE1/3/4